MDGWKTQLMGNGNVLGTVDIKRGIFQGDSLSPLLFVMIMIPLSMRLRDLDLGYMLKNDRSRKINHLLFMDDLKLYARTQDELDQLVSVVKGYSDDIGMQFGMSKCQTVIVKRGKRLRGEGLELPDGNVMKDVDEQGYKYLGVLQKDSIMEVEMKAKVKKEYFRRLKCLLSSELYAGNLITGINAWAIGIVRYTAGVLSWGKRELYTMDIKTRKTMTMHGVFHIKGDVDRLYLKRKDGGRGLISVTDCVRMEEENLVKYVATSQEWMLKKVLEHGVAVGDVPEVGRPTYKSVTDKARLDRLMAKPLHGRFFQEIKQRDEPSGEIVAGPRSWDWVKAGYMTPSTESYLFAAQEQAINTNAKRCKIYKERGDDGEVVSGKCRVCGEKMETVMHVAGGCGVLMKGPGTVRHDRVGLRVHWELCKKYDVECSARWYEHKPQTVAYSVDGKVKIYWDYQHYCGGRVQHNKPDVFVDDSRERLFTIIDFAVPLDHNVVKKEREKVERYHPLAQDYRTKMKASYRSQIIPVVVGAFGTIPKNLPDNLTKLGIPDIVEVCR